MAWEIGTRQGAARPRAMGKITLCVAVAGRPRYARTDLDYRIPIALGASIYDCFEPDCVSSGSSWHRVAVHISLITIPLARRFRMQYRVVHPAALLRIANFAARFR